MIAWSPVGEGPARHRPHALVPALTQQVIRLADHRFAGGPRFGRALRQDRRHRACARQRLGERFAVAAGDWCGVVFGGHARYESPTSAFRQMALGVEEWDRHAPISMGRISVLGAIET